ncbi:uncharacterized protein LOC123451054 isoform X2 [Hordeum vulgare subsp. vulgare]|uniref:uncharacterized protein LOC123451054 isoform X2 n=1 Tax=Hordeum vulgare subsp. vulgare TaxID=112509 RepID=UPI001D1A36CF|nr:uncharacterized protein LOC123451054 isoform X2 [Hordeum vulgare subsp. vulgare]
MGVCLFMRAMAVVLLIAATGAVRALVQHTIEVMKPGRSMKEIIVRSDIASSPRQERLQTWRKHGRCPGGTVPIRRASPNANTDAISALHKRGHREVAAAYGTDGPYHGLRANVPYWRVDGVHHDEFSMNYIMIGYTLDRSYIPRPGAEPPAKLTNQIIVGLVNDGGVNHHCYNHECGGFTLTNNKYALGCSWSGPGSEVGGERRSITLGIHRDDAKLIWWVSVMDVDIGYYSEDAFDTAFPEGSYVEMGGRVLNTRPGGKHTRTPMDNGMPACAGSRFAATIFEYLGVNAGGQLFLDAPDRTVTTTPGCYGAKPIGFSAGRAGYVVAYGGPGGIYCDQPCC